jgi:hypothetical protein
MAAHDRTGARQVKGETLTREKPVAECECCGYENPVGGVHISEAGSGPGAVPLRLCTICANTHAATAFRYPHSGYDLATLQAIAWIGNRIRADLNHHED